jgi:hypothetical protein
MHTITSCGGRRLSGYGVFPFFFLFLGASPLVRITQEQAVSDYSSSHIKGF